MATRAWSLQERPLPYRAESGPGISTLHSRGSWCQLPWRWPFASDILVRLRRTELLSAMGHREGTNERPQAGKIPALPSSQAPAPQLGQGLAALPGGHQVALRTVLMAPTLRFLSSMLALGQHTRTRLLRASWETGLSPRNPSVLALDVLSGGDKVLQAQNWRQLHPARATSLPLPEHRAPGLLPVASKGNSSSEINSRTFLLSAPLYCGDVDSKLNRQGRLMLAPLLSPSLGSKLVATVVSASVVKHIALRQPFDSWT